MSMLTIAELKLLATRNQMLHLYRNYAILIQEAAAQQVSPHYLRHRLQKGIQEIDDRLRDEFP